MNRATQPRICALAMLERAAVMLLAILVAMAAPSAPAQTFEAPGAGTGVYQGTVAVSINTAGTVTGFYLVAGTVYHGFVRAANGTIT